MATCGGTGSTRSERGSSLVTDGNRSQVASQGSCALVQIGDRILPGLSGRVVVQGLRVQPPSTVRELATQLIEVGLPSAVPKKNCGQFGALSKLGRGEGVAGSETCRQR